MFWSWINNFVQQFTNHYYHQSNTRPNSENAHQRLASPSTTTQIAENQTRNIEKNLNQPINSSISKKNIIATANMTTNTIDNRPVNILNDKNISNHSKINKDNKNLPTGYNKERKEELNKSANNQFDGGGKNGAYLDNLRKLLNLNIDEKTSQLLDRNRNQNAKQNESFYQNWLTEYRNMQLKGKQKLASKVDQMKESLNQLKENNRKDNQEQHQQFRETAIKQLDTPRISLTDESCLQINEFNENQFLNEKVKLIKNDSNCDQIDFNQLNEFYSQNKIDNKLLFQANFLPNNNSNNNKTSNLKNLPINSDLLQTIKVSQAQSYHQQLNISAFGSQGSMTPVSSFRAQVKRSSYPSGLRTTGLRIGPRLNRDKSRSRLV